MSSARPQKQDKFEQLISNIKRDKTRGTKHTAQNVAGILKDVADSEMWKEPKELIDIIKLMGTKLIEADPTAFYIGNIVKRILHTINMQCESYNVDLGEDKDEFLSEQTNCLTYLIGSDEKKQNEDDKSSLKEFDRSEFQAHISESLLFIESEIEEAYQSIAEHCYEQIQNNDSIMTIGYSRTVLEFFIEASKNYEFSVLVVENSPKNTGEAMSKALAKHGINTTLISDSSVFAYLSKIGKIIISTRAIMADGGLMTDLGVELVVQAAHFHNVPVIVISTLYKLTPLYPFDNTTYNTLISSDTTVGNKMHEFKQNLDVVVPKYDYIEPEYISLYITNFGCHTPKYIYREFAEYYSKEELLDF